MKKTIKGVICTLLTIGISISAYAIEAIPSSSNVLINGHETAIKAYNIEGNNYFKLRDIAFALKGTDKQFDVGYDENTNSIFLTTGKAYTGMQSETSKGGVSVSEAVSTNQDVIKDGTEVTLTAYNIDGSNYFKLRDLGEKFDFSVDYDEKSNSVLVDTATDEPKDEGPVHLTPSVWATPAPAAHGK